MRVLACHLPLLWMTASLGAPYALAQQPAPAALHDVGIDQRLDAQLPLDAVLRDEGGRTVRLGDYFGKRPVVLALVYFKCPMLCTMVLNDLVDTLNKIDLPAGKNFDVVAVSFDPSETPELAAAKKATYLRQYRFPDAANGWHFLTGPPASIAKLTHAVGFRYAWDDQSQTYAHASGVIVLTPTGRTARYFFGINYDPIDLRLSLIEASREKTSALTDSVLLYCFHYDPHTGKYGLLISRLTQIFGAGCVLALASLISLLTWRERGRRSSRNTGPA